jgi:uncharacterized protein YbaR (Trm112 family)
MVVRTHPLLRRNPGLAATSLKKLRLFVMLHPKSIPERLAELKTEMRALTDANLRYVTKKQHSARGQILYQKQRSRLLEIKQEIETMLKAFSQDL